MQKECDLFDRLVTRRGVTDTLLLVEDDRQLATFLADNLTADGFELLVADSVRDGRAHPARRARAASRSSTSGCPTARASTSIERPTATSASSSCPGRAELDRVRGFERGADDYLVEAVLTTRSCCCASGRCCAGGSARPPARLRVGRARDRPADADRARARRAGRRCRRRSSRCCARWRPIRRASSPRRSCCATSGAGASTGRRGRWTRTPAGCGASSASAGDRFVLNVWGVGYRLDRRSVA